MCDAWKRLSPYRYKHVELLTTAKNTLCGFVHALDPETGNIVLLSEDNDGEGLMHVVTASAIKDIKTMETGPSLRVVLPPPRSTRVPETSNAISPVEPQVLVDKLRSRRIDASIVNSQMPAEATVSVAYIDVFSGVARIVPPFYPHCVRSDNHNVLGRVRAVIQEIYDQLAANPPDA